MSAPSNRPFAFPKRARLIKRRDFDRLFEEGERVSDRYVLARVAANDLGRPRAAFVTPRTLGCHARRNRVRRVLREAFRLNQSILTAGVDVVFLPKRQWTDYRLAVVEPSLRALLRKIERRFGTS